MISWWKVEFGEIPAKAAYQAVAERRMTMGPLTAAFEKRLGEILDVPHVVAAASGTAALTLALLAAGVGPGDEVIVPNRTWIATAHAPRLLGAEVVLVDVEADRPVMPAENFAAAITPKTKAVIPVHLNGQLADMERINAIAERHGVIVIEDACQALFSRFPDGKCAGTKSHAGCFSFSIGKPISCGQGGAVVTQDAETAKRLVLARTHGVADVTMAYWETLGGNFRFWDLPAAVALTQLDRFEERKAAIISLYKRYKDGLRGLRSIRPLPDGLERGEIPIYAEYLCERRDALMKFLMANGIQARPYYPNLNTAPQFAARNPGSYRNSDPYAEQCFVLPSGPDRSEAEIAAVLSAMRAWESGA
ncbi:MAG: DegT/DnrJ/EryC1/StrS family aminotransferase [Planctomycetota bacterium]|jgi:dTDP-4-amino-4,6-dideoxygalactose transaminase|nr:DegT/DnrJ/EryC1/StrS family aminotransferase [Planctomycetota bacterium]